MGRLSSCCRKTKVDKETQEPEPVLEPVPKPKPKPKPEPQPQPEPSKNIKKAPEEPKIGLSDLKEFSIVCVASKPDPADPSKEIRNASIHIKSDKEHAETIINIMERAKRGEKSFLDNSEQKICFLRAISATCRPAQESGPDTMTLPYSEDELAEVIMLVAKTLPIHAVPPKILP